MTGVRSYINKKPLTRQHANNTLIDLLLFLHFLMRIMLPAPIAVFFEVNFALHLLAIPCGPIVDPLTLRAGQFYEVIL